MDSKYRNSFIPPLNLSPKTESIPILNRILGQKGSSKEICPSQLLKQNSEFVKEKCLYRYYISKNKSTESQEKLNLTLGSPQKLLIADSKQKLTRILSNKDILNTDIQLQKSPMQLQLNKQKYFKRKNHLSRTQLCRKQITEQNTMDNEQEVSQESFIDLLKERSKESKLIKRFNSMKMDDFGQKDEQIAFLKEQNSVIVRQNNILKQNLLQKQEIIHQLNKKIAKLEQEAQKMKLQVEKVASRVSFTQAEEAQLQVQLSLKESIIKQLQSGYKYIEIENTMLNHAKSQCSQQKTAIQHLEREKRMLQEKVRLLYELNKKKNRSRFNVKEDSEASLTFSIDKEEKQIQEDIQPVTQNRQKVSNLKKNESTHRVYYCADTQK